jgi:holliday junction DNA helicase RuvA
VIAWLEGSIHSLSTDRVVVKTGGVGYAVNIPLSTYYRLEKLSEAKLHIHTQVREDVLALFGFSTTDEKAAFEKLITISGIGPKLAQSILSGIEVKDLAEAIARGDSKRLNAIPGVGAKTADRIVLELRDKLILSGLDVPQPAGPRTAIEDDVVSALVNLGYKPNAAEKAVARARSENDEDLEFPLLLKASLRHLTR